MPDHTPRAFAPTIPCGEVADLMSLAELAAASADPVRNDKCDATDRELLLQVLAEVQLLRQEVAALSKQVKS
jgi:hypothetical protein